MNDEQIAIEAEADLRDAIHDAYETASRAIHDSTEWESVAYPNDRTVYEYLANNIVLAAKNYFYKRSGNIEAALKDELFSMRRALDMVASLAYRTDDATLNEIRRLTETASR